jgi:hypothetical protein
MEKRKPNRKNIIMVQLSEDCIKLLNRAALKKRDHLESILFKIVSFIVAMIGLVSSIVTIVTGYQQCIKIVKNWMGLH